MPDQNFSNGCICCPFLIFPALCNILKQAKISFGSN